MLTLCLGGHTLSRSTDKTEVRVEVWGRRDTEGVRRGTFTLDCVDCIIHQSNDSHYGGLWKEERRR